MTLKKISERDRRKIAELRELGWSYGRIATKFKITQGAVHYHCMMQGAVSPHSRAARTPGPQTLVSSKTGRIQRRFTPDEDKQILELGAEGASILKIARLLGRAPTSIRMRLAALELRADGYGAVA